MASKESYIVRYIDKDRQLQKETISKDEVTTMASLLGADETILTASIRDKFDVAIWSSTWDLHCGSYQKEIKQFCKEFHGTTF